MKQKLFFYPVFLAVFIALNCSATRPATDAKEQNVDYLITQGKQYWDQRTDSTSLMNADHFIRLAHEQRPQDFDLAVLYGRILYTRGLFFEKDEKTQDDLFIKGLQICRDAVMEHPDFSPIYERSQGDTTFKLLAAIVDAPKSIVPGLFWWATNLARHLNSKPVVERLNHRELIEVMMHRIISLDPGFHYSGPYRFFGSMYTRIPGVGLSQSETYFNQALSANPKYLGNAVHMAEFYHQKVGNREQFHSILQEVIAADPTIHPEIMGENLFYQGRAKLLLSRESSLFE